MKKFLILLLALFLFNANVKAATTVIENYDAKKLKNDIIEIYAQKGSIVEFDDVTENTFTVESRYLKLWGDSNLKKTFTIVQNGKNCILSLDNNTFSWLYDAKELQTLKQDLKGGYTYGLTCSVNLNPKQNKNYTLDGVYFKKISRKINNYEDVEIEYYCNIASKYMMSEPKLISSLSNEKEQNLKKKIELLKLMVNI